MIKLTVTHKKFQDRCILENTNINIKKGDFFVITGPSGVGKSSLLNIIGLLDKDFLGEYFLNGSKVSFTNHSHQLFLRKKHFGYVFQNSLINDKQSISRNILCTLDYDQQKKSTAYMNYLLKTVGLIENSTTANILSGGEKQRLAIVRALIKNPDIILADEPTASLDRKNKEIIMNILKKYNENKGTVVMVTHDIELLNKDMTIYELTN